MNEITGREKCSTYTIIIVNIIISLIITFLLLFGFYDISLLELNQKIYLILSLLSWMCLFITYITKLIMLLFSNLIYKKLVIVWFSVNLPALISLCVAFIYDITQLFKGKVPLLLLFFYIIIIYFTIKDYYHISLQVKIANCKIKTDAKQLKYNKIE